MKHKLCFKSIESRKDGHEQKSLFGMGLSVQHQDESDTADKILAGTSPVKPDSGRPAGTDKPDDGTGGQQRFAQRRKSPAELYVPDKGASDKQRDTAKFRQRKPDNRHGRDNRKNWNHKSGQANRGDRSKQTDRDSQVNGDDRETSLPFFVCQRCRYRRHERDHGSELVYRRDAGCRR